MKAAIRILNSVHFATVIFILIVMNVMWGYFSVRASPEFFNALNETGLVKWIATYGIRYESRALWLFILIVLLSILVLSTLVCTTIRCFHIIKISSSIPWNRFIVRLSPHIMHYGVVIVLAGYLISYLFAQVARDTILIKGSSIILPDGVTTLQLEDIHISYYRGDRLDFLKFKAIDVKGTLVFRDSNNRIIHRTTIGINKPVWFKGISIHLKDFAPRSMRGMYRVPFIHIVARKDPGILFYFSGTAVFLAGLLIYIWPFLIGFFRTALNQFEPVLSGHLVLFFFSGRKKESSAK